MEGVVMSTDDRCVICKKAKAQEGSGYCRKCEIEDGRFFQRVAAARCLVDAVAGRDHIKNKKREVYAFLSLFHPEMSDKEKREVIRDIGRE